MERRQQYFRDAVAGFSRSFTLFVTLLVGLVPAPSLAIVLEFETVGQSMWEEGAAGSLDETIFVGPQWDTDPFRVGGITEPIEVTPGIPRTLITPAVPRRRLTPAIPRKLLVKSKKICVPFVGCTKTPAIYSPAIPATYSPAIPAIFSPAIPPLVIGESGAYADISSEGKVGLELSVQGDAGSVNANVDFEVELTPPEQIAALEPFVLEGDSSLLGSTAFNTNFPELSAYIDFVFGAKFDIDSKACALGACASDTTTLGFFDETLPGNPLAPASIELISLNRPDENGDPTGKIRLLGLDNLDLPINFGDPISVTKLGVEVGNVTVFIPDLETDSTVETVAGAPLTTRGSADILDLKLDLDGIATVSSGGSIPPLGLSFDAGILSVSGDILDVEFGPIIEIIQEFRLEPELMVDFEFSDPVLVAGENGPVSMLSTSFSDLPEITLGIDQEVVVTPNYWVDTTLYNTTRLGLDGEFTLDVLKADFDLSYAGLSYGLGEVGPVFSYENRFDIADLPPLIDREFRLGGDGNFVDEDGDGELDLNGGFERIMGDIFTLSTRAMAGDVAVPEPVLSNAVATLITGSPVQLSQIVSRPATTEFEFSFDYLFATATGILDVFFGSTLVATLHSPGVMSDFIRYAITLNTADIFNSLDALELIFRLDQSPGSSEEAVVLLDNVVAPGIRDGSFDAGSVNGLLPATWRGDALGSNGFVGIAAFDTVPVPSVLLLIVMGLLLLQLRGLRFSARLAYPT